jgi:drug/metabolite transporter (DMT)-like permease
MLRSDLISKLVPWSFIFCTGMFWGLAYSLGKIAVEGGKAPLGIALYQSVVASVLLYMICLLRGRPLKEIAANIRLILALALFAVVIPNPVLYTASEHLQAGILTIILTLVPMITYGASIPIGFEKFNWMRGLGLLMGIAAIMLIVLPEGSLPDRSAIPWILFALIAAFCYTGQNIILTAQSAVTLGPIRLALGMNTAAVVMLCPLVYHTDGFVWPGLAMTEVDLALIGLGIGSALVYTLYILTVSYYGSVFASQTAYIVTLAGVFWGMVIFSESHSLWVWGALAIMIIGLALVKPNKAVRRAPAKR